MDPDHPKTTPPEPLLATWIKWTMDSWEALTQMGPGLTGASKTADASRQGAAGPLEEGGLAALHMWEAFFSLLSEPRTVDALFTGIQPPSQIILRMAQIGWGGYFHLHQQWLAAARHGGLHPEALRFEDLEQDAIKALTEVYEEDFQRLLHLPALGLMRSSQERKSRLVVKFGQFKTAMTEFMYLLYLPMKKSLRVMQEKLGEIAREGKLSQDFKEYYKMWLKILEGHYMTLLKSPEYMRTMSHALNALEDYSAAKQEVLADALQVLAIPTDQDMDELYQEIYLLKKQVKELSKKLAKLEIAPCSLPKG